MITLNLDQLNAPDKEIQQWIYPDGVSTQVRISDKLADRLSVTDRVRVVARLKSAQDIMNLMHLLDIVENICVGDIEVVLPYLPYSRADRRFSQGDTYGLKVFLDMIHMNKAVRVKTFDIHSDKLCFAYGIKNIDPWSLVRRAIDDTLTQNNADSINVLLPDEGAIERYPKLKTGLNVRVLNASKKRDPQTGVLSGFMVPAKEEFMDAPILIVDDLCDGGGTFLGISNELRQAGITQSLNLYVSHGIFSKGLVVLLQNFDRIFTTNTLDNKEFANWSESQLRVYDAMPSLTE